MNAAGFTALAVALGAVITFKAVGGFDYERAPDVDPAAEIRAVAKAKADCRESAKCTGELHAAVAEIRCRALIERQAQWSHEWTVPVYETFSQYRWTSHVGAGRVTYIGDRVKFQNGFGAWSPMIYECDFDPTTQDVIGVRLQNGRL